MNSTRQLFSSLRHKAGSFNAKLFYLITVLILVAYISFSFFFFSYQRTTMKSDLLQQGKLLSRLLAYSSRLGVFAENKDLLEDPINGILKHKEVTTIDVFTLDGRKLESQANLQNRKRSNSSAIVDEEIASIRSMIKTSGMPHIIEELGEFIFWAPVFSKSVFDEDTLYFDEEESLNNESVIGFVRIGFTTELMKKELKALLLKSVITPFIFIVPVWIVVYLLVKGITRPLKKLTEGVVAVGEGGSVELVETGTEDEIGKLAQAFNDMVRSLHTKEAEKKQIEEQLRQSQKMEAIGTLAGGIAHDFNNILSVIIGYVNLLQRKNDFRGSSEHYINNLLSTSERASSLIKSLLAFSRPQSIELKPVVINSIFCNLGNNLLRLLDDNIECNILLPEKELFVMSDAGQLEQLIVNLSINARDAMPEGGTLTISADNMDVSEQQLTMSGYLQPGQYVIISVSDTGTGINKDIKEKIFEPFFTTKEVGKGTGLGLSMVYGIIKHHKGYIDVSSEPGKGTTFYIYLKLIEPDPHDKDTEHEQSFKPGNETILLAEDNADLRILTTQILQQAGYRVIEACDGKDAIEKFKERAEEIDFLLFDVRMPKVNGLDAYLELKNIRHDIKVLFVSGHYDDIANYRSESDTNKNNYQILLKPLSPDVLIGKIRESLDTV